ncbi:peptidoglycan-binding protein LysM [Flavobacterium flabelliforme]|uniref:peptidoglycan-binding protein LysM n=1 Tax=Flavobacterium flabelliforme TaxID=2816119 RepID=UPI00293D8FD8|nr:peptidoglycan-binding protein LysM [Flavobacterium flabelliforme]
MKEQIVIAALALEAFIFGTSDAQAQATSNAASTTVNLILSDVISIDAGSVASNGIVDFNYVTSADYNAAKNVTVANSLIVTSSKNFDVKVKAGGADFSNGTNKIPVNVSKVQAVIEGSMVGILNTITLSTTNQKLVTNATSGFKNH